MAGHVRHFPLANCRQDDPVEKLAVCARSARLALRLNMLSEEAFGEVGYGQPLLVGGLVRGRVGATLYQPEQPLRLAPRELGRPGRAMLTDRQLAHRSTPAGPDSGMQDVATR